MKPFDAQTDVQLDPASVSDHDSNDMRILEREVHDHNRVRNRREVGESIRQYLTTGELDQRHSNKDDNKQSVTKKCSA